MARIRNVRTKSIRFKDVFSFSDDVPDLELIDIINDATKELTEHNFVTSPGAYVYELDLVIDEKRAIDLGVEELRVDFFVRDPNVRLKPLSGKRSKSAILRSNRLSNFLKTNVPVPMFTTRIDMGLPQEPASFQFLNRNFVKKKRYTYHTQGPEKTQDKSHSAIVSALPLLAVKKTSSTDLSPQASLKKTIFARSKDPAQVLAKPSPVFPTLAAKLSFASVPMDYDLEIKDSETISLNNILVRRSLEEARKGISTQQDDDSNDALRLDSVVCQHKSISIDEKRILGFTSRVENTLKRIRRQIELPKWFLGDRKKIWVRLTPILKKGDSLIRLNQQTQPAIFDIDHRRKVEAFLIPEYPPEISLVKSKPGNVVLRVKQVDPGATKIKIVKRSISQRRQRLSKISTLEYIKTESDSPANIVYDFEADNVFPNIVVYRAVALSPLGDVGPATSLVVKGDPVISVPFASEDPNDLAIVAKNEKDHVLIEIEKIPDDVITFRLLREDLDEPGEMSERVSVIATADNETQVNVSNDIRKLAYEDKTTSLNRRYRYFAAMRAGISGEFLSEEDEVIIRKAPVSPLPIEISLENTEVTEDESGNLTTSVNIVVLPRSNGIDFLMSALEKAGIDSIFINELRKQKSIFADLATFIVERVDRSTGRRVSFGPGLTGEFKDDPSARRKLRIPSLTPGNRYTYFFKLCLNPPQSFMKSVFTNYSTSNNPGVDEKKVLAQKFMNVFSKEYGVLPSNEEMITGISVGDNIRGGETGLVLQVDVKTPKPRPLPTNLRGRIGGRRKKYVILSWDITEGDPEEIDHCLVFVEYAGQKTCIGTVPSLGGRTRFYMKEKKYFSQVGKKVYTVKLVYDDYKISPESNKLTQNRRSSIPKNLLVGRILGLSKGNTQRQLFNLLKGYNK